MADDRFLFLSNRIRHVAQSRLERVQLDPAVNTLLEAEVLHHHNEPMGQAITERTRRASLRRFSERPTVLVDEPDDPLRRLAKKRGALSGLLL